MLEYSSYIALCCHDRTALRIAAGPRISIVSILAALLLAVTSPALSQDQSPVDGKVAYELRTHKELPAPVQRAAIDPELHTVRLATRGNLYKMEKKAAQPVTKGPAPNAQLVLAPGGLVYAWLVPAGGPAQLWDIHLRSISDDFLAKLKPEEAPHGFGAIYLGFRGKLIVTVTPIDDWQGIHGRFRYTFWNLKGRALNVLIRPTCETGIMATDGKSFLLLGREEAAAYSPSGKQLWRLKGRYRNGAIAGDGYLALLNPSSRKQLNQVVVFSGSGKPAVLDMPTPVHHLVLAPDGSAVVGGDRGRYFFLDPAKARFKEGKRLPFDAELFLSELGFVDHDTLAIGVLQREGDPPRHSWPRGGLAIVKRSGEILFRKEYPISRPISSRPAVNMTFDVPIVIGFTLDMTVRIDLGR